MLNSFFLKRSAITLALTVLASACGSKTAENIAVIIPAPPASAVPVGKAPPPPAPQADIGKELAAKVQSVLASDKTLAKYGIDVTVREHAAQLFGTVGSIADQKRARNLAMSVDGIESVDNKLVLVQGS